MGFLIPDSRPEAMGESAQQIMQHRRLTQVEVDAVCARHDRLWSARMGGARAVFAWKDLTGLNLSGRNLCDADFTGAILADCNLQGARLDNANLFGADVQNASMREASLRRADLRGACLRGADLTGADLFEADLREGTIAAADRSVGLRVLEHTQRAANAQGAVLAGANLERSRLSGVVAMKADFSDAILKDAKLVRANLKQANFSGANFAGADLSGADLAGANLRDAVLVGAKTYAWNVQNADLAGVLTDAPAGKSLNEFPFDEMLRAHALWCETQGRQGKPSTFDGADLRGLKSIHGLNLTALSAKGAVFYGLDMSGVQMQGAHLEGCDLRTCNLRNADLRGARLAGARLNGSDLRDAQLGPLLISPERSLACNLTGAVLKTADLSRADLRQALLVGADLSRANFTGALLKGIDVTDAIRIGVRGLDVL
jgi:uncharacterized protein YjbI with pentapeptide repeats